MAASNTEQPQQPPLGVSASLLRELERQCRAVLGPRSAAQFSTTDACTEVVKPATAATASAFVDAYRSERDAEGCVMVGAATVFVSHAWKFSVFDVIAVMLRHEQEHPHSFFWFDLAVNNQHKAPDLPQGTRKGGVFLFAHVYTVIRCGGSFAAVLCACVVNAHVERCGCALVCIVCESVCVCESESV